MHEKIEIKPKSRKVRIEDENFAALVLENWKKKGWIDDYAYSKNGVVITPKVTD